jgi:hypothetical protein
MPYDEYTIDAGETLSFRMVHHGLWIPVVISREALEAHFGELAGNGLALIDAYRTKVNEIEERIRPLIRLGVPYSRSNPLRVGPAEL